MSINVIERNVCDCKYVEFFNHCIRSIGAPSRTVFIWDANTEQWEGPKITGRKNIKANIFQKESTGLKTMIDLNKKKCIKVVSLFT
jgi:hypothetical protein